MSRCLCIEVISASGFMILIKMIIKKRGSSDSARDRGCQIGFDSSLLLNTSDGESFLYY